MQNILVRILRMLVVWEKISSWGCKNGASMRRQAQAQTSRIQAGSHPSSYSTTVQPLWATESSYIPNADYVALWHFLL